MICSYNFIKLSSLAANVFTAAVLVILKPGLMQKQSLYSPRVEERLNLYSSQLLFCERDTLDCLILLDTIRLFD